MIISKKNNKPYSNILDLKRERQDLHQIIGNVIRQGENCDVDQLTDKLLDTINNNRKKKEQSESMQWRLAANFEADNAVYHFNSEDHRQLGYDLGGVLH